MPTANFYLKPVKKSGISLIFLQFKYNAKKCHLHLWSKRRPSLRNKAKQRVRSNKVTTSDGQHSLNDLLDNLKQLSEKTYNESLRNGIPSTDVLKQSLTEFLNQNSQGHTKLTLYNLADRFIRGEIKNKGKEKSKGSLQNYAAVVKHL